ncbi:unnamed protein product [Ceratitis capitata]|uniref:(Mediterranean fruit fly) hypothetical protein n=1 Tax=Ceratitis capitata TaxID=7213 RepID=A0A811V385_CERCA|nr:unnamed protein product [Ceratitis capitata]
MTASFDFDTELLQAKNCLLQHQHRMAMTMATQRTNDNKHDSCRTAPHSAYSKCHQLPVEADKAFTYFFLAVESLKTATGIAVLILWYLYGDIGIVVLVLWYWYYDIDILVLVLR